MPVLVEGISVIVRRGAIDSRFRGGWRNFESDVPNRTLCTDEELARVGFMSSVDVEAYVGRLEMGGLTFVEDGRSVDVAVVDQLHGPTVPTDWLEFAEFTLDQKGNKVLGCWLVEGPRITTGHDLSLIPMWLSTPAGWTYENSLSADSGYVANYEMNDKLTFLRHEGGKDIYLDRATGKEAYIGRTEPHLSFDPASAKRPAVH